MVIQFLCPNGHKIHCEQDRAGKPAKCPRCGVRFRVPELSELGQANEPGGQAEGPLREENRVVDHESGPTSDDLVEFLCPNGHRLHGRRSMQGEPGECPECGVQFRVPFFDDPATEPPPEEAVKPDATPAPDDERPIEGPGVPAPPFEGVGQPFAPTPPPDVPPINEPLGAIPKEVADRPPPAGSGHPLANLVSWAWAERAQGAVVELHLNDGRTITPDRYAPEMSQESIGVFGLAGPDGNHTLVAVAWDCVSQVEVRGLQNLPTEFRG